MAGKSENMIDRVKMVKAMEFIARQVNDEEVFFNTWLPLGVADGDIKYGDLSDDSEDVEFYLDDDEEFADLMGVFLDLMAGARRSGGLYCDGVVSSD